MGLSKLAIQKKYLLYVIVMVLFTVLLMITVCSILLCCMIYIRPDLYYFITGTSPPKLRDPKTKFPLGPSAFPEYINMKAPDVLVEMNAKYPQYSVEFVNPDTVDTYDTKNYREDRVRLFVSRGGLVKQIKIG